MTDAEPAHALTVTSEQFKDGDVIPESAPHDAVGGGNRSPQLSWTEGPAGTKSSPLRVHVCALDIEETGLDDHTTYAKFRFATKDHVSASGTLVGLYAVPGGD
jgi:phosphatidylethanolamine-binding protein (PEBP) family uncharacterized protein